MNRFLIVLALLSSSAIAAQADSLTLTPGSQTLPVSTSAAIDVTTVVASSSTAPPYMETVTLDVLSGPDAGTSVFNSFTNFGVPISISDTLVNDGTAGTDIISATASLLFIAGMPAEQLTSNTVDVIWTSSGSTVPEPSSFLLLLTGVAGLGLLRRRPWSSFFRPGS